jgi:Zn-dependent protease
MDFALLIQSLTIYALPVLLSITLHEAAHGYVARYFGDDTAYMLGRVTLNPLKHIDLVGTVLVPLLLYITTSGSFLFGYAKPVPVRMGRLRNPKRDMVWVALAGPASNLVQALLWGLLLYGLQGAGVSEPFFIEMAQGGILVNVVMWVFNLFPLPPLDGGRILVGLLPMRAAIKLAQVEPYGFFIVMALILTNVISNLWMRPLMQLTYALINLLLSPFASLVGV